MSILDHELITERYFFPRTYAPPNPTMVDVEGAELACHATNVGHPLVVVHFHGNGEVVADYVPEFEDWIGGLGADCFLAEYRGYGASTGTPQLGRMLDDIPAIYEAVGRPESEIVVFGRSVGSIYAIEFAYRYPEVAGLVLESGIADPMERITMRCSPYELGASEELLESAFSARLDHMHKLRKRRKPTLVMHARNDSLVDVSHAARLASAPKENVDLVVFPRGDHNTVFAENRTEYVAEMERFLRRCRPGADVDTTHDELEVPEDTFEMPALAQRKRSGPGETKPMMDVPVGVSSPDDVDEVEDETAEIDTSEISDS